MRHTKDMHMTCCGSRMYIAAQFGKAIAEFFTMHRICSNGDIDCFCDSPVGDEA